MTLLWKHNWLHSQVWVLPIGPSVALVFIEKTGSPVAFIVKTNSIALIPSDDAEAIAKIFKDRPTVGIEEDGEE